ncbi:hypothetical protein [Ruminiclostridium josui]|uniref:hypothetical protein n=1 Tax=Ruminiclostridium josui TaxID=1499 RepID=UPI0004BB0514|nr:hypothetical protein [Ruminiclostridium josui]
MREVFSNLYCGSQSDYEEIDRDCLKNKTTGNFVMWAIVHACKEPHHRTFVGYTGRGCPKDSPEYLWAECGNRLALNIVDAPKPEFFDKGMIDKSLDLLNRN